MSTDRVALLAAQRWLNQPAAVIISNVLKERGSSNLDKAVPQILFKWSGAFLRIASLKL
jgi:hypothetical protein